MVKEKIETYLDIINIFTEIIKKGQKARVQMLGMRLAETGLRLAVLAPDIVYKQYLFWRTLAIDGSDNNKTVNAFGQLLLEMRKDLGETKLEISDILDAFL